MDGNNINYNGHKENRQFSLFFKLLISFLILAILIVLAILVIFFVLRLKTPLFHLQSILFDNTYKFDSYNSTNEANDTCTVASLVFSTQNPNIFGIRYGSSSLKVLYDNNSIAMIDVPSFYQPSKSENVTVFMHFLFKQKKINQAVNEGLTVISSTKNSRISIQVIGGIKLHTRVFNLPLPKIKVYLDCSISTNYDEMMARRGVHYIEKSQALPLSSLPHIQQDCSIKMHRASKTFNTKQFPPHSCF
ncbi:hypothetical protein LUZ60_015704 [Juncus effusus]|nr:hypothetical protein LUZ60_015704 [Juncus effusus]